MQLQRSHVSAILDADGKTKVSFHVSLYNWMVPIPLAFVEQLFTHCLYFYDHFTGEFFAYNRRAASMLRQITEGLRKLLLGQ